MNCMSKDEEKCYQAGEDCGGSRNNNRKVVECQIPDYGLDLGAALVNGGAGRSSVVSHGK